jgi:hypothetical protein
MWPTIRTSETVTGRLSGTSATTELVLVNPFLRSQSGHMVRIRMIGDVQFICVPFRSVHLSLL